MDEPDARPDEELLKELEYDDNTYMGGFHTHRYVKKEEKPPH